MKHQNKTKNYLLSRLVLTIMTMLFTTTSIAAWNNSTDTTPDYVDSVHSWGAWELDIEPAAGGLQQASTQVVNPRESKATLRINSVSALAPQRPAVQAISALPANPTTPAVPAIPTVPAITPISSSVPIPVGGPNNGF